MASVEDVMIENSQESDDGVVKGETGSGDNGRTGSACAPTVRPTSTQASEEQEVADGAATSQSSSTSSNEDEETQLAPAGAPKTECCEHYLAEATILVCRGLPITHKRPRSYHAECVGEEFFDPDVPWFCDGCRAMFERERSSQATEEESSQPLSRDCVVRAILGHREIDGKIEYLLRWGLEYGRRPADTWVNEEDLYAGELLQRYRETGVPAYDSEAEEEIEDSRSDLEIDKAAGNTFWPAFERGYWSIIREVHKQAREHKVIAEMGPNNFHSEVMEILGSVPRDVLQATCGAGLMRRKLTNEAVAQVLRSNLAKSEGRPSIYMLELVDERGRSPTAGEMRRFIKLVRQYAAVAEQSAQADIDWALKVDAVFGSMEHEEKEAVRHGFRRYLTARNRESIRTLLQLLELDIQRFGDSERLPYVLSDVGYSDQAKRRITEQHLKHQGSNKIMNLFEAISLADSVLDGVYTMKGDVIFLCYRDSHAATGEILFSFLADSYCSHGRGFNGVEAGRSVESSTNKLMNQWHVWMRDTLDDSPLRANLDAERERVRVYSFECDNVRAKNLLLKSQILRNENELLEEQIRLQDLILGAMRELSKPHPALMPRE